MSSISGRAVWERLAVGPPKGDDLTARLAQPDLTDRLLAAVDADGLRHLLITLKTEDLELRDVESRGLSVVTTQLIVVGQQPQRYIDIGCREPSGHEILDLMSQDLATLLAQAQPPARAVEKVLAKWRRFWGTVPRNILSREGQLGLFAELWFLLYWLTPEVGSAEAVARWRGPAGARHDFEWMNGSVEVKATASARGIRHEIHGLEQLAPPDSGVLGFYSLQLRDEGGGQHSLPELVKQVTDALGGDANALNILETMLSRYGYAPVHEEIYSHLKLRVAQEGLYVVKQRFPRLTPDSFPQGVPAGVEYVNYGINLTVCSELLLRSRQAESEGSWIAQLTKAGKPS